MVVLPLSLAQAGVLHWTMTFMLLMPFKLRNLMQLAIIAITTTSSNHNSCNHNGGYDSYI
jgi:hypothetical protein